MKKFVGPDIYERNTYRAKVNEDALMSRVRKDKLFWLYQQAEEALRRHASEVSRTPLPQFDIPTAQLSEVSLALHPLCENCSTYGLIHPIVRSQCLRGPPNRRRMKT
jgi:hypothetical protein